MKWPSAKIRQPTFVEKEGVRFCYLNKRISSTPSQLTAPYADPPFTHAEIELFNSRTTVARLLRFTHVRMTRFSEKKTVTFCLELSSPVTKKSVIGLLDTFLEVRRLLANPTRAEALNLLIDKSAIVRTHAIRQWAGWQPGWKKTVTR
jgi:hypothetical protein